MMACPWLSGAWDKVRGDTLNEDLDQMTEREREHYQEGLGRRLSSHEGSWGNRSEMEVAAEVCWGKVN